MFFRFKWRKELAKPTITAEQFERICTAAMKEAEPGVKVHSVDRLTLDVVGGDWRGRVNLRNAFASLPTDPEHRIEIVGNLVEGARGAPLNGTTVRASCVPLIKSDEFLAAAKQQAAQSGVTSFELVVEPLVADLHIAYACDRPTSMQLLDRTTLEEAGVTASELRELAIQNLPRFMHKPSVEGDGKIGMVVCGGNYEASLLLVDDLWKKIGEQFDGDVLACVPARDMMMFADSDYDRGLAYLREVADEVTSNSGYLVSRTILVRRGGGWEEFERRG